MEIFDEVRSFWTETFAIPFGWAASALQIRIFGAQLWQLLLSLMVFSIFAGFIAQHAKGSSGLGRSVAGVSVRGGRSGPVRSRRTVDKWSNYSYAENHDPYFLDGVDY